MVAAAFDASAFSVAIVTTESRKRRISRPVAMAIGASILAHAAAGTYLYFARYEPHLLPQPAERVLPIEIWRPDVRPPPPPPRPEPVRRDLIQPRETPVPPVRSEVPPLPLPPIPADQVLTTTDGLPSLLEGPGERGGSVSTPEPPRTITQPQWLSMPTAAQMERFVPERAVRTGVSGRAVITCQVRADGRLEACAVVSETPDNIGYGNAAIRLSQYFRMRPRTVNGEAVSGARVNIPITFTIRGG